MQGLNAQIYDYINKVDFSMSFTQLHELSIRFAVVGLVWLLLLPSIWFSLYCLWEILSAFGQLTPFQKLTKLLCHTFLWTTITISYPFGSFNIPVWAEGAGNLFVKFCLSFKLLLVCFLLISLLSLICETLWNHPGIFLSWFFGSDVL